MAVQRSRRTNPYPFTWEIPLALAVGTLFLLVMGLQVGRSVANLVAGNGWVFVDRSALFTSLPGILTGRAGAGLEGIAQPASSTMLWTCVVIVELATAIGCVMALVWGLRRWGPSRLHGVATRSEAETLLGRTRLRKHAKVIRPDLYGREKRAAR